MACVCESMWAVGATVRERDWWGGSRFLEGHGARCQAGGDGFSFPCRRVETPSGSVLPFWVGDEYEE